MRIFISILLLTTFLQATAQEDFKQIVEPTVKIDSLYREDQFYFAVTYNLLTPAPEGLKQDKFSSGISFGFLRDMPINKDRTVAVAAGLGFSYRNYFQNLTIKNIDGTYQYEVKPNNSFNANRFKQYLLDVPIELRWRNSTYESHKFWRIYGGLKLSYVLSDTSILRDATGSYIEKNNPDLKKFQYGLYVATGYNTWNLYAYYGLSPLYNAKTIDGEKLKMKSFNVGLIFYIL